MSIIKKEVSVSKETSELADSLVSLVKSIREHVKDGFQAGQDVPAILMENLQSLMKGVEGVDQLDDEAKENLSAFVNAWSLAGSEMAGMFLSKTGKEEPTAE